MATSISLASPILLVILFNLLLETNRTCFASNAAQKAPTGHRFNLTRVGFGNKIHKTLNSYSVDKRVAPKPPILQSAVKPYEDEYVMEVSIGTPPVTFSAIVDTGSDLIWTKCKRKTSSEYINSCDTFQLPGAVCEQRYADGKSVKVNIVKESLTIGDEKIPNVTFGCGIPSNKFRYGGVVGMGRGEMSLVSQLNEKIFSYCLAHSSENSILLTGELAMSFMANSDVVQTPFLKQGGIDSLYYVSLEGISVGNTRLSVNKADFAINSDGTGGMIIDSGTTFTYLENGIITMIENEFMNQTKLKILNDNHPPYKGLRCFESTYDVKIVPKLVFHFSGADWDLPRENYIYEKNGKACLAFIANDKKDAQKVSIFGNMQQRNMMVLYDLDKNSLSFKPANCNQL